MTAYVPMTVRPLGSTSSSSARIGTALHRIAYFALCTFVVILPWGEAFPMLSGILLANWIGLLIFGAVALRAIGTGQVRRLSPLHYWMLALVAWIALSALWTVDWDSTAARVVTFVQLLILAWLIWELAVTQARIRGLLLSYVLGALVASGITVYNFMAGKTAAQLAGAQGIDRWETSRYSVAGLNENDLGLMLALSIPMVFYLLVSCKDPLVKLLCWLQLVAGITAILLTASRGALTSAIAGLLMFPLTLSRLPRRQKCVSLVACIGLVACAVYLVPASSWSRIFTFTSEVAEGTLTHRTSLWTAGLEVFRDHAFLGVGAGAYGSSIVKAVDIPYVAHNTFLSVLVELGVVGALLLFGLLASLLYCTRRMQSLDRRLWITLLLTWAVGVSALTWEYRKPTWLLFGLAAAHACVRRGNYAASA